MSAWVPLPGAPLLIGKSQPNLLGVEGVEEFRAYVVAHGAQAVDVNLTDARTSVAVIEDLKAVLAFPSWCGSGWDSVEDAFEELRGLWRFPLLLLVHGADELINYRPQLTLETFLRLADLSRAFAVAGDQFIVAYSWSTQSSE